MTLAIPTGSDLTQTGETLILQMANDANPNLSAGPLSATNVTLGTVSTLTGTPNSAIALTAVANQGYSGSVTVTYNRLDIQTSVMAVLAPTGATLAKGSFTVVADLLPALNTAYNLGLVADDLANGATVLNLTNGAGSATLVMAPTSLKYLGTLTVTIA